MKPYNLAAMLPLAGLTEPEHVTSGDHWQLWTAIEAGAFERKKVHILYLDSRASWAKIPDVTAGVRAVLPKDARYHVIVQNSATIATDLARVERDYRAVSA